MTTKEKRANSILKLKSKCHNQLALKTKQNDQVEEISDEKEHQKVDQSKMKKLSQVCRSAINIKILRTKPIEFNLGIAPQKERINTSILLLIDTSRRGSSALLMVDLHLFLSNFSEQLTSAASLVSKEFFLLHNKDLIEISRTVDLPVDKRETLTDSNFQVSFFKPQHSAYQKSVCRNLHNIGKCMASSLIIDNFGDSLINDIHKEICTFTLENIEIESKNKYPESNESIIDPQQERPLILNEESTIATTNLPESKINEHKVPVEATEEIDEDEFF